MSSKPTISFQEWSQEIARQRAEKRWNPKTFIVSSCSSVLPNIINDYILESLKLSEEQLKMKEYLFGAPKYVVSGEYIPFELIHQESPTKPRLKDSYFKYFQKDNGINHNAICRIETNNEKEKEKMEAKKCERCGKLYEMEEVEREIEVFSPAWPITEHEKKTYTPEAIKEINSRRISVVYSNSSKIVDLCPECRKKFKNFFESGMDETNIIKKAEE